MTALSPSEAALFADSAYAMTSSTDMVAAAAAAGSARDQFDIVSGERFTGSSGVGPISTTTGFGYVAFGKSQARAGECLISVRGTQIGQDWLSDAYMAGERGPSGYVVHKGFNSVANSILPQVRAALRGKNPSTIHLVGHSLGGAAATVLADALSGSAAIKLYTFGAPRAGSISHARHMTRQLGISNIHRVYHDTDPVPMVPIFPFAHIPTTNQRYLMPGSGTLISFGAHSMSLYNRSVNGNGWGGLPTIRHRRFSWDTVDDALELASSGASGPVMMSSWVLRLIGMALEQMLGDAASIAGTALFASATVLDRMAQALSSAAATSMAVAETTRNLIETIMQFMGRTIRTGTQITVALIRWVLDMLFTFIATLARRAAALVVG